MIEKRKKYYAQALADAHINYLFRMSQGTLKGNFVKANKNFYETELQNIDNLIEHLEKKDHNDFKEVYPERKSILLGLKNELEIEKL